MVRHLVFVYGSLRRGEVNHALLCHAKQMSEKAWTRGLLYATNDYYPAMVKDDNYYVYGELYEVDDDVLRILDNLEDYDPSNPDSLYYREKAIIETDSEHIEAYTYFLNERLKKMLTKPIYHGDWRLRQTK